VPGEFDAFDEVFAGGTVSGTVCIAVPTEDLGRPDTQVSINFGGSREYFGAVGTDASIAEIIPADPTSAELEAGSRFNPFPVDSANLSLESAEKEPLPDLLPTLRCCR